MNKRKSKLVSTIVITLLLLAGFSANAIASPKLVTAPSLGAAGSFAVLGFSEVTNTGATTVWGDVGVWSGTLISGVADIAVGGAVHATDGVAQQAQADASSAVGSLTGQAATAPILGALDGLTLTSGVYDIGAGSLGGGVLTLDGEGVYIFRASSSLTSAGSVNLINGARGCDVFWYVPTQANLVGGSFVGTIIAGTGIVFGANVSLSGRALAIGGNVTMISNRISQPSCASAPEITPTGYEYTATSKPDTDKTPVPTLGIPDENPHSNIVPITGKSNLFVDFVNYVEYLIGLIFK